MKKYRIVFIISVFFVSILLFFLFNRTESFYTPKRAKIQNFFIVETSGERVFYKTPLIDPSNVLNFDLSNQKDLTKLGIYVDNNTAYRFRYFSTFFSVLPNSFLKYANAIVTLVKGEYYWEPINLKKNNFKGDNTILFKGNKLFFSKRGRIKITDKATELWNYEGVMKVNTPSGQLTVSEGHYLKLEEDIGEETASPSEAFLPKPTVLKPKEDININNAEATIVQFQWKDMVDFEKSKDTEYILRLYGSKFMEKLPEDPERFVDGTFKTVRRTNTNNIPVEFSALKESNTIYWRIFPYNKVTGTEGEPTEIRKVTIADSLINNKEAQLPPFLKIGPPIVSGSIVIISGEADPKSRLFIDGKEYEIDEDGKFNLNLTYKEVGIFTITFELISPSDIKNIQTKQVRIL